MRNADIKAGFTDGKDAPLIKHISGAVNEYVATYNFMPETLIVSPKIEGALQRWAVMNKQIPADLKDRLQGASLMGMEIRRMTKRSALVEFYLSTRRNGIDYYSHAILEPETAGVESTAGKDVLTFDEPIDWEDNG